MLLAANWRWFWHLAVFWFSKIRSFLHISHFTLRPATMTHNHANYQGRLDFIQNLSRKQFNIKVRWNIKF